MAKHLKKKSKTTRLFSSKPGRTARIPAAEPEEQDILPLESGEREQPVSDLPELGMEDAGPDSLQVEDIEPTAITAEDLPARPASAVVSVPAPPKPEPEPEPESEPEPEPAPVRRVDKKPSEKTHRRRRTAHSRRSGRRVLMVLGLLLAAGAVTVVIVRNCGGSGALSPLNDSYVFSPKAVESSAASKYISDTAVMVNDGEVERYTASDALTVNFGLGSAYTSVKGITTFRGDNFRSSASYGTAALTAGKFTQSWSSGTGSLADASGGTWTGSGWTGQPLIVSWPDAVREKMTSLYDWARKQTGLVEVIYPTMDGKIYFSELSTGKATRDPMDLGFTFKGTGSLDPRGYPILYVGSGANSTAGKSRVFIINLLNCTVMYRFGYYEPFAQRDWNMWDAAPLVDAATDQLIYPGENGLLYILHLNTLYDEAAGSLTVNPDNVVKWRYNGVRTSTYTYWTGFEASPVCWQGRILMADNGGNLICLDLNTLKVDWVCDVLDDTSCSPVLSVEEDGVYLYLGGAFHPGWRAKTSAAVPIYKINAVTGEVVWETDYTCTGDGDLSGGVQGTLAIGKNQLAGLIFVPLASTPDAKSGKLVALDTKTGKEVWHFDTDAYSWSSPVDVYDAAGKGYLTYATGDGTLYLLDGKTGKTLDTFDLGGAVEASPAVYNDWLVIGTRSGRIWGVRLG